MSRPEPTAVVAMAAACAKLGAGIELKVAEANALAPFSAAKALKPDKGSIGAAAMILRRERRLEVFECVMVSRRSSKEAILDFVYDNWMNFTALGLPFRWDALLLFLPRLARLLDLPMP